MRIDELVGDDNRSRIGGRLDWMNGTVEQTKEVVGPTYFQPRLQPRLGTKDDAVREGPEETMTKTELGH